MTTGPSSYSLPSPPVGTNALSVHFCKTFLRQFHNLRGDETQRILDAIEKTAAMSGHPPEVVAKTLVENGLRAQKESFPNAFVAEIEKGTQMPRWAMPVGARHHNDLLDMWGQPRPLRRQRPRIKSHR